MFISVDLWSAPLVGPLMVCCVTAGSNRRTGAGFAEKYTHPINAKAPKRGLHYRRICTVVSGSRGEGGWGQSPGGRNATRRDQDVSESYESQSPVLPGMHRAGVGLRRMEVVCSAQSGRWWDHLWAEDPRARWQPPILPPHRQQGRKSERTLQ